MTLKKIFFTAFFIFSTSTFFISTVYAGADFGSDNSNNNGGSVSVTTPNNSNENINQNNNPPKDNNDISDEFLPDKNAFDFSDDEENSKRNETPKEVLILPNENQNSSDEDFNDTDENLNNTDDEDFTENENIPLDTGVIGDINGDRELNAVDLVVLQKYLKGNVFEINENAADIDGDGDVSKFDVYALLNLIKAEKKGTGDVNNDGKVDIYDVQSLTAYFADQSKSINSKNADLNGDGRISIEDLKILKKVIAALRQ